MTHDLTTPALDIETTAEELTTEQLETTLGGFAHGGGAGGGKVSMNDISFLLPAV